MLVSNHDSPFTRELYQEAKEIVPAVVSRKVSLNPEVKMEVKELIALF